MTYRNALENYIKATNTHQFENVEKLLHSNAVYWFGDKTCTTISEIQSYFIDAWNAIEDEIYNAQNIEWLVESEHTATCIYQYTYEGYLNGKSVSGSGRATNVFKKENGEWKLIHEHLSNWRIDKGSSDV